MSSLLVSTVGGRSLDAPGAARFVSTDPAHLDQVVAEVALADADTFVAACRSARRAQRDWPTCRRRSAAA